MAGGLRMSSIADIIKELWAGRRSFGRATIALGSAALIVWLGGDAIAHIDELYDGLCPNLQGPGMAHLLYDGDPQGNCTGIGADLSLLGFIMGIAALALPAALAVWWYFFDVESRMR
jgi:hypothetical protein